MIKSCLTLTVAIVLFSHTAMALNKPLQEQTIWPTISAHCEKPLSPSTWRRDMPMTFDTYQKVALANRNKCIEQYYEQKSQPRIAEPTTYQQPTFTKTENEASGAYSTPAATHLTTTQSHDATQPTKTTKNPETLKKTTIKNNSTAIHWY